MSIELISPVIKRIIHCLFGQVSFTSIFRLILICKVSGLMLFDYTPIKICIVSLQSYIWDEIHRFKTNKKSAICALLVNLPI